MTADFGPCSTWPLYPVCDLTGYSPAATGYAASSATRILWALSGRQFGTCTTTLRLCRPTHPSVFPHGHWALWSGPGWYGDLDWTTARFWYPLGCGGPGCAGGCSCARVPQVALPEPISSVDQVVIDGAVLDPSAYRVDDNRFLVRTDGADWPLTNDLSLPDGSVGTWTVQATYGQAVPDSGRLAMGELTCEILRAMSGEDCRLPAGVTQLVRQGVTISVPDFGQILLHGRTGLYLCDMFLASENPKALRQRARVYSVDGPRPRRTGT